MARHNAHKIRTNYMSISNGCEDVNRRFTNVIVKVNQAKEICFHWAITKNACLCTWRIPDKFYTCRCLNWTHISINCVILKLKATLIANLKINPKLVIASIVCCYFVLTNWNKPFKKGWSWYCVAIIFCTANCTIHVCHI